MITSVDYLFVRTIDDLRSRINSHDHYELLGTSLLLRKLLLDDHPLIDQVNRSRRFRIRFAITDINTSADKIIMNMEPKPVMWSWQDGLDPEIGLSGSKIEVSRGQFLSTTVLIVRGDNFSVRDMLLHTANVMGAVHMAPPKNERQRVIDEMNTLWVGNVPSVLRTLLPIGRIVIRSVNELYADVANGLNR